MFHNLISLIILPRKRKRVCFKSINAPYSRLIVKRTLFKRFFEILISICKPTETSKNSSSTLLMLNLHWTVTLQKIDVHCLQEIDCRNFSKNLGEYVLLRKKIFIWRRFIIIERCSCCWTWKTDISTLICHKYLQWRRWWRCCGNYAIYCREWTCIWWSHWMRCRPDTANLLSCWFDASTTETLNRSLQHKPMVWIHHWLIVDKRPPPRKRKELWPFE